MAQQKITSNEITSVSNTAIIGTTLPGAGQVTKAMTDVASADGTGSISIPSGTTEQRPASPQLGYLRYNTSTGYFETYTASGWGSISTPPSVVTISPTTYNGEQGTQFTINGSFFDAMATVKFITTQGQEFSAGSVTYVNSSQLLATTPQDFTVANEPLSVKVVAGSGLSTTVSSVIDCGGVPAWVTASGLLANVTRNIPFTTTISATDADANATISYSVTSGSLPANTTLYSANGVISGNTTSPINTTFNFNVAATDNAGNQTARSFSLFVNDGSLMYQPAGTTRLVALSFDGQNSTNIQPGGSTVVSTGALSYVAGGPKDSSYYATNWTIASKYLQVSGMSSMAAANYSFVAWYKGTQTTNLNLTWQPDVVIFGDPRPSVYAGGGLSNGKLSIGYNGQSRGTTTVADGNWHCLAYVMRSNRYIDGYVDGNLEVTVDCNSYSSGSQISNIYMDYIGEGYHYASIASASNLDGIQIYSGTLTQAQIQQIYNGGP